MAMIGYLGGSDVGIPFVVSREVFRTPKNMKWSGSARYAVHERHATHALTEFTGLDPDCFSFDMLLTAELGVNPMEELVKIWTYERDAEAVGLVMGGHAYGKYRWTIEKHETKMEYMDTAGDLYAVEVSVTLLEYLKGESHNTSRRGAAMDQAPAAQAEAAGPGGASGATAYTVKKGDSLWAIAQRFYGSGGQYAKIYEANRGVIGGNPSLIYPGQILQIP